jgi:hypothetical protein
MTYTEGYLEDARPIGRSNARKINPVNVADFKQLIKDQPGLNSTGICAHFNCDASRYFRALKQLRDSYRPFEQSRFGRIHFYDPVYAYDHKIPLKISKQVSSTGYRNKAKAREAKREEAAKLKGEVPDINPLWMVRPIAQYLWSISTHPRGEI